MNNTYFPDPESIKDVKLKFISEKIYSSERISEDEGLYLFNHADLSLLGVLANYIREKLHGKKTFYNKNIHIEPSNICIHDCKFCSYRREKSEAGSWEYSIREMLDMVKIQRESGITEIHIVGSVHPKRDIWFYTELLKSIKELMPFIHIKAFSAVEIDYMINKAGLTIEEGLQILKDAGLGSIPGGGAEIFNYEIRKQICGKKSSSELWLKIHETAHNAGIKSNSTMLYGHIETYADRIDHLNQLRNLQDKTNGFNAFIPLKFKSKNNSLSDIGEVSSVEDLRNFAVSRIYLDNIPHIKAYWPMLGKDLAQIALSFGADDLDGTIKDTTRIYSMAGSINKADMSENEITELIKSVGFNPVERDSLYNQIK